MYKSEPDYVTGRRGRLDLYPWVTHPPFCVCVLCPTHRPRAAEKSGKSIDEVWSAPLDIRIRRDSPYPTNRKLSAAAALLLKADEEKRLAEAVANADAERRARQTAVSFGHVVAAYRRYLAANKKDYRGSGALLEKHRMVHRCATRRGRRRYHGVPRAACRGLIGVSGDPAALCVDAAGDPQPREGRARHPVASARGGARSAHPAR